MLQMNVAVYLFLKSENFPQLFQHLNKGYVGGVGYVVRVEFVCVYKRMSEHETLAIYLYPDSL